MNLALMALAAAQREADGIESRGYAWLITKDHMFADNPEYDDSGVTGPSDAPAHLLALLKQGEGTVFKMYDDDGELYYSGRLVTTDEAEGTEDACYGPLGDFGMPNAGAVRIHYPSKPEWDCE